MTPRFRELNVIRSASVGLFTISVNASLEN